MCAITLLYKKKFLTFKNEIFKIKNIKNKIFIIHITRPHASGKIFFGINGFFFSVKFKFASQQEKKIRFGISGDT
jgi:hypothetical protein